MKRKNYYEVLGIRPTASNNEIELAYRGRRTQYHPDKYSTTDEKTIAWATIEMQAVNNAYNVLSNAVTRAEYDRDMIDSDTVSDLGDGDYESEEHLTKTESFAEQLLEICELKGSVAKDRLNTFSAIQTPTVDSPQSWKKSTESPAPLPPDVHKSLKSMKIKRISGLILLVCGAISLIIFPLFHGAWMLPLLTCLLILSSKPNEAVQLEQTRRRAIVEQFKSKYEKELSVWDETASGKVAHTFRDHVISTSKKYISFVNDLDPRVKRVIEKILKNQLDEHLRRMRVSDSSIAGVGPSRKETLMRHGIKSAADVKRNNFIGRDGYKIPSIGESVYNSMVAWRDSCVDRFETDWSHRSLAEKLAPLFDEFTEKTAAYDSLAAEANHVLTQKITNMKCERVRLRKPMQAAANALAQAEMDYKLLNTNFFGVGGLVATWIWGSSVVDKPVLEHLDNTNHTSSLSAHSVADRITSPPRRIKRALWKRLATSVTFGVIGLVSGVIAFGLLGQGDFGTALVLIFPLIGLVWGFKFRKFPQNVPQS